MTGFADVGGICQFNVGRWNGFRVKEANGLFAVVLDNDAPFEFDLGMAYYCPAGDFFKRVEIQNLDTIPLKVSIMLLNGNVFDDRLNLVNRGFHDKMSVVEGPLRNVGYPLTGGQIAPFESIILDGTPPAGCKHRRTIIVSNEDTGAKITVTDPDGNRIALVQPLDSAEIPTADEIRVVNTTGNPIAATISQQFYLQ